MHLSLAHVKLVMQSHATLYNLGQLWFRVNSSFRLRLHNAIAMESISTNTLSEILVFFKFIARKCD